MIKLIAVPQIDVAEFPLRLTSPNCLNTGGYLVPGTSGSIYTYSIIDMYVAGLEASRLGLTIFDLVSFFDKYKNPYSCHQIYVSYRIDNDVFTHSLAEIKDLNNIELLRVLHRNAPLTFKWSL